MKPKDKILTYEQARELKWFCQNVTGVKTEFYKILDEVEVYKNKIERLSKQADDILDYCEKNNIKMVGER